LHKQNTIMNTKQAIEIIKSKRFFSAEFIKKDGSTRQITGQYGVKKHLKPNAKPQVYKPAERGYLTIWDLRKKEYRLLNTQTIVTLNGKGISK
jgi:hypothetical protein